MENFEINQPVESSITVSNEIREYLLETSKWGKFLAIVGYVGMGLILLIGLGFIVGSAGLNAISDDYFPVGAFGLIYIVLAVLYYFPVNYLHKFSVQMKSGIGTNNQNSVTSGFENLKSLFKFMGIFTIVVLSIYAVLLVVVLPLSLLILR